MPIKVVNKHNYNGRGTYIGRSREPKYAPFGNPFTHLDYGLAEYKVATREESIERYKTWVWDHYRDDEYFRICLHALVRSYLRSEEIILVCWCDPLPCHGHILKEIIENMATLGVVQIEDQYRDGEGELPF